MNGLRCSQGPQRDRQEPERCSEASQSVLGPHGAHLLLRREFPTGRGGLRGGDGGSFVSGQRDGRFLVALRQPEDNAGDVVLRGRRQIPGRFKRLIEQSCDRLTIALSKENTTAQRAIKVFHRHAGESGEFRQENIKPAG